MTANDVSSAKSNDLYKISLLDIESLPPARDLEQTYRIMEQHNVKKLEISMDESLSKWKYKN
jgi:hypothetical protein